MHRTERTDWVWCQQKQRCNWNDSWPNNINSSWSCERYYYNTRTKRRSLIWAKASVTTEKGHKAMETIRFFIQFGAHLPFHCPPHLFSHSSLYLLSDPASRLHFLSHVPSGLVLRSRSKLLPHPLAGLLDHLHSHQVSGLAFHLPGLLIWKITPRRGKRVLFERLPTHHPFICQFCANYLWHMFACSSRFCNMHWFRAIIWEFLHKKSDTFEENN